MPSSVLQRYRYNEDTRRLRIYYNSGAVYDYLDVPPEEYEKFRSYLSKGGYLNRVIKQKYEFQKIELEEGDERSI